MEEADSNQTTFDTMKGLNIGAAFGKPIECAFNLKIVSLFKSLLKTYGFYKMFWIADNVCDTGNLKIIAVSRMLSAQVQNLKYW